MTWYQNPSMCVGALASMAFAKRLKQDKLFVQLLLGHLEKFFSPSGCESDSLTAMGHVRMERASHGADGLFRC